MTAPATAAPGGTPHPTTAPASTDRLERIPLSQLHESPLNPRKHFDQEALIQLKDSLLASGQLEPVLVRPRKAGGYELAAGHRRFRAAKLADQLSPEGAKHRGLGELLAIVRDMDDRTFIETLNIDNLQRDDLHPLEEAQGFRDLMTKCGYDVKKIAARIGKSERYVYDSLSLLKLVPEAKKLFLAGRFERGHAIEIARCEPDQQKELIDLDESGSMWGRRRGLWEDEVADRAPDPTGEQEDLDLDDEPQVKAVSVRELKTYIDDHYRADPRAVDPFLFPDAAQVLAEAQAKKGRASRVVHITYDHRIPDAARDEKIKTYGSQAWQRADGQFKSKSCDYAQPGFVAAGPGRGEAFLVCVSKEKCPVHWRDWQRERERRQKERAAQQRRIPKEDRAGDGAPTAKPSKPAAPEPDVTSKGKVLDALIERLYPGILKVAKQTLASLKLSDEIVWNVTHAILKGNGFDWQKPPKRPSWGGPALDDFGIGEAIEAKLRKALGGAFRHDGHRNPTNVAGARTALTIEICLSRDFDAGGIEKLYGRELDTAWKAELKRRAAEKVKPTKAGVGKKPTAKKRATTKAKKVKKR